MTLKNTCGSRQGQFCHTRLTAAFFPLSRALLFNICSLLLRLIFVKCIIYEVGFQFSMNVTVRHIVIFQIHSKSVEPVSL